MNELINGGVNSLARLVCFFENPIIFVLFLINLFVFFKTKKKIKEADKLIHPPNDRRNGSSAKTQWSPNEVTDLEKIRTDLVKDYTFYANITAIFPLLGILGTVAALVTYSDETKMENFMVALSTTLLGVSFAILFKFLDTWLSAPMDGIIECADYVQHENDREKRHRDEA